MKCDICNQELKYILWDSGPYGASEYEYTCSCGYEVHYAYGWFTYHIGNKEYHFWQSKSGWYERHIQQAIRSAQLRLHTDQERASAKSESLSNPAALGR